MTPQKSISIVIVEDEQSIAESLAMVVEEMGYAPYTAPNGKVALDVIRAHRPALVITDLMMPVMDGAALVAALRQEAWPEEYPGPRIVLISAASADRMREIAADAHMPKPFDLNQFEMLVRRLLRPPTLED